MGDTEIRFSASYSVATRPQELDAGQMFTIAHPRSTAPVQMHLLLDQLLVALVGHQTVARV